MTALHVGDNRLSNEQLAQLLTPLQCLQELTLRNFTVRSAGFLRSGSLPRALRSLRLCSNIPAAELEQHLPQLGALTSLVLFERSEAPLEYAAFERRLRPPSALLPQLQSFSNGFTDWIRRTHPAPFQWD